MTDSSDDMTVTPVRPRRSVLYMPGSNARALEKAKTIPADALILDLEDAVAPDKKDAARDLVAEAVRARGFGRREVIVRMNGLDTGWGHADVPAAVGAGADAILMPKVESAEQVQHLEELMESYGAASDMTIMCMMETPLGILNAAEIAASSPRLSCLVMGTSDLTKDLQAEHTPDRLPMMTSLGHCLLAARAHGLAIVDGVHLDLEDADGLAAVCAQGRAMGFDGKTLIHPKQVDAANRAFAPGPDDVEWSERIIAAFAEAEAAGQGVVVVDGKLIENLHVENARRVVALADAIAVLEAG